MISNFACGIMTGLNERIAELEKELTETQNVIIAHQVADETGYVDGEGWVKNWAEIEEKTINILEAHNLEREAKGIEYAIDAGIDFHQIENDAAVCNAIRTRAKAKSLKEQVK